MLTSAATDGQWHRPRGARYLLTGSTRYRIAIGTNTPRRSRPCLAPRPTSHVSGHDHSGRYRAGALAFSASGLTSVHWDRQARSEAAAVPFLERFQAFGRVSWRRSHCPSPIALTRIVGLCPSFNQRRGADRDCIPQTAHGERGWSSRSLRFRACVSRRAASSSRLASHDGPFHGGHTLSGHAMLLQLSDYIAMQL